MCNYDRTQKIPSFHISGCGTHTENTDNQIITSHPHIHHCCAPHPDVEQERFAFLPKIVEVSHFSI